MSERAAIRDCLDSSTPTGVAPWIYGYGAVVEQVDLRTFHSEDKVMGQTLRSVVDLFNLSVVVAPFDTTIEAEALGCDLTWDGGYPRVQEGFVADEDDVFDLPLDGISSRGRLPAAIDGIERLSSNLRTESVVAGVTGPGQVVDGLSIRELSEPVRIEASLTAGDLLTELVRDYVDAGADAIALIEPAGLPRYPDQYAEAVEPILNLLEHYNRDSILVSATVTADLVDFAEDIGFDGLTGTPTAEVADTGDLPIGYGVPTSALHQDGEDLDAHLDRAAGYPFVSSSLQVGPGASIDRIHELMETV